MKVTKPNIYTQDDINNTHGRDRVYKLCCNKYIENNRTLKKIDLTPIEYNEKEFINTGKSKQIKELQRCIKIQQAIFKECEVAYKKDIQKYWYISQQNQKYYQYTRPFPKHLMRRGYGTVRTQDKDWIPHGPEREQPNKTRERKDCNPESINYRIGYIRRNNNLFNSEHNIQMNLLHQYEKWILKWYTKEQLEEWYKERITKLKENMRVAKQKLEDIINNPRGEHTDIDWDYDPKQHGHFHTIIWDIWY